MTIRLLLATPSPAFESLMSRVLDIALELTELDVTFDTVTAVDDLFGRIHSGLVDVILLDWDLAHGGSPLLVRRVLAADPRLRLVAMLPLNAPQYRKKVWTAGACSGIPKEHVDQEWLATVLCIMQRAMEREARLLKAMPAA